MRLEDYIKRHKEDAEEQISDQVWNKINSKLPRKQNPWPRYFKYAAAILLFVGVGYIFGLKKGYDSSSQIVNSNATLNTYTQKVNQKRARLETLVNNHPELEKTFAKDLSGLQIDFESLKKQLPNNPNQEIIIQAMIENLEWQIDLLNQQTKIAEKSNFKLL